MSKPLEMVVPALPLKNTVLFPFTLMPLAVSRPFSMKAVEAAVAGEDKSIAVFAQKDASVMEPKPEDLHTMGTLGVVKKLLRINNHFQLVVLGKERVVIEEIVQKKPYFKVRVRVLPELKDKSTEAEAVHRAILDLATKIFQFAQISIEGGIPRLTEEIEDPIHQVYFLASILSLDLDKEIKILSAPTRMAAFQLMHKYLLHEAQVLELRNKIASKAQSQIGEQQREYMLRQQMEEIQKELGERTPEQLEVSDLRKRMQEKELPDKVQKEVGKELARLERMSVASPDYQIIRSYAELAIELPWTNSTQDNLDLDRAGQILDEDHFDLKNLKERIIEHLAVMKLNPAAKAPILCFVGPPGVGKTSVGQSIARALGRNFERMSLGGMHDEAELRGHRRTYIGAMPGRIIQAIRRAGVRNPLLMLDEVDKLGRDFRGDPAAALMEVLDPAQNFEFRDNYLDLPFDLSKVFFITTANTLDSIPKPLLDRMETLRLPGYSDEEKREIARRYLIGRQLKEAGLKPEQLTIPDSSLHDIIRRYTHEAGVRGLERMIGSLARKVATRVAKGRLKPVKVNRKNLSDLLGPEFFFMDKARQKLPAGVAPGLAWTEAGGEVLYVEAVLLPDGKDLTLTGQLGDVMKESARTAQSYIWAHADDYHIDREIIRKSGVHIHVPAGAVPKDGPSAGVTMVVALASLYAGFPSRADTAMTGEITLSGWVLPVGGIKEKILAAHRLGMKRVILPKDNLKDLSELPEHVREKMEFVTAQQIGDVLVAAIPAFALKTLPPLRAKGA